MSKVKKIYGIFFRVPSSISHHEATNYYYFVKDHLTVEEFNHLKEVIITLVDDDHVNINCEFDEIPFERVRRITGYLSTENRFNNAKLAELNDRVKHSI